MPEWIAVLGVPFARILCWHSYSEIMTLWGEGFGYNTAGLSQVTLRPSSVIYSLEVSPPSFRSASDHTNASALRSVSCAISA